MPEQIDLFAADPGDEWASVDARTQRIHSKLPPGEFRYHIVPRPAFLSKSLEGLVVRPHTLLLSELKDTISAVPEGSTTYIYDIHELDNLGLMLLARYVIVRDPGADLISDLEISATEIHKTTLLPCAKVNFVLDLSTVSDFAGHYDLEEVAKQLGMTILGRIREMRKRELENDALITYRV